MRWARLAAILSLWTFFSGFIVLVHLWISVLGLPNRWVIISRLTTTRFLESTVNTSKRSLKH
jgi:hypothetical protein